MKLFKMVLKDYEMEDSVCVCVPETSALMKLIREKREVDS